MYSKFFKWLNKILVLMILTHGLCYSARSFADLVIIVNPANTVEIDMESVKKIFMGRTKTFINDEKANPIDKKKGALRSEFLAKFLNKDEGSLQSYWTRLVFSGKGKPPVQYDSDAEVKKLVASDVNAISYIDSANIDETVRVVDFKKSLKNKQ